MSEGGLREVREEELKGVSSRLAGYLPYFFSVHGVVGFAARYGLQAVKPATIFIPARSHPSSLTVVTSITTNPKVFQSVSVFWSPEEEAEEDVAGLLATLPAWDWTQPVHRYSCSETVLRALEKLSLTGFQQLRVDRYILTNIYTFDMQELPIIQLPDGYYMTSLRKEDVETIWTHSFYNRVNTRAALKDLITAFPSIGVRRCDVTDMNDPNLCCGGSGAEHRSPRGEAGGKLVSWVHLQRNTCMGNTCTLPQHRRLGLAKAATAALARRLLQEGQLPSVTIEPTNYISIKLHESLGFQRQCEITNAYLLPTGSTLGQVFTHT